MNNAGSGAFSQRSHVGSQTKTTQKEDYIDQYINCHQDVLRSCVDPQKYIDSMYAGVIKLETEEKTKKKKSL